MQAVAEQAGTQQAVVYVVDDDAQVRALLARVLEAAKFRVVGVPSAEQFLADFKDNGPSCVVLDLKLPGMNGVELIETMRKRQINIPVLMISAHGDVQSAVKSMKLGAVDFLEKTGDYTLVVQNVNEAIARDIKRRAQGAETEKVRQRFEALTPRERELLDLLAEGQSTKMIASQLNISNRTVDHHRANLMSKTSAANVADLIRMWMMVRGK